jgi:hypothetical protein
MGCPICLLNDPLTDFYMNAEIVPLLWIHSSMTEHLLFAVPETFDGHGSLSDSANPQ